MTSTQPRRLVSASTRATGARTPARARTPQPQTATAVPTPTPNDAAPWRRVVRSPWWRVLTLVAVAAVIGGFSLSSQASIFVFAVAAIDAVGSAVFLSIRKAWRAWRARRVRGRSRP